ncbi:MAG: rhomboid family intramembrane serine protease [Tepidisphaeraceae bacterium]
MGFQDRDYYRNDPMTAGRRAGSMSAWTVNTWIIVINIAVYIVNALTMKSGRATALVDETGRIVALQPYEGLLYHWGYFSFDKAISQLQAWRFISFQFLHDPTTITHILFNMFALYMFGPFVESLLGRRRYLAFYLLCGIAGPIMYILIQASHILPMERSVPLIGASAGVFGVLIATARIAPNAMIQLLFPPIPMKLKTFAWVMIGIAVFTVFTNGRNAGGEAAHLGGAAMGLWLISNPNVLNLAERLGGPRRPKMRITY